eukprot:TRINITY_DN4700_c0_g1_i1.p1 TRINITY_DN4700_c0_g1~~TRINITY_DN4700_c0_g1_i1.p1  ORF type:complete len:286 (+),score=62.67 TRINITY_DN4700_c0_g1_i1:85-942(+)
MFMAFGMSTAYRGQQVKFNARLGDRQVAYELAKAYAIRNNFAAMKEPEYDCDSMAGSISSTMRSFPQFNDIQLEYRIWMLHADLVPLYTASIEAGYASLAPVEQAVNAQTIQDFAVSWQMRTQAKADQLQKFIASATRIPIFRRLFSEALTRNADLKAQQEFSVQRADLGMFYKRGKLRTERWQKRTFVIERGLLMYFNGSEMKGVTLLKNARMVEPAQAPASIADRAFCFDLYVEQPNFRVFLLAAESAEALAKFRYAVDCARRLFKHNPDQVMEVSFSDVTDI